jgi:hypothetical protein
MDATPVLTALRWADFIDPALLVLLYILDDVPEPDKWSRKVINSHI